MKSDPLNSIFKTYPKRILDRSLPSLLLFSFFNILAGFFAALGMFDTIVNEDFNFFTKYLIFYIGAGTLIFISVCIPIITKHYMNLPDIINNNKINIKLITKEARINIRKIQEGIYRMYCVYLVCTFLIIAAYIPVEENQSEWLLNTYYLKKYFRNKYITYLFTAVTNVAIGFVLYIVANVIGMFLYINGHLQKESLILNQLILSCAKTEYVSEEEYQWEIFEKLKYCIREADKLRSLSIRLHTLSRPTLGIMYFSTICEAAFLTAAIILNLYPESLLKMKIVCCFYPISLTLICHSFQKVATQYEIAYNSLLSLPWTTWNKRNKKMYILFLLTMQNPHLVKTYYGDHINYETLISMARIFYGAINIFVKTGRTFQ